MQQAQRVADQTVFMYLGKVIEKGPTEQIFNNPQNDLTKNYISGHFWIIITSLDQNFTNGLLAIQVKKDAANTNYMVFSNELKMFYVDKFLLQSNKNFIQE